MERKLPRDEALEAFDLLIYGKKTSEIEEFIPGRSARMVRRPTPEPERQPYVEQHNTEYAEQYQKEHLNDLLKNSEMEEAFRKVRIQGGGMSLLEDDSTICNDLHAMASELLQRKAQVFDEYDFKSPPDRKELSIDRVKSRILDLLKTESVVVVKGFTGCGKTTQVPQFVLDECARTKTPCNIVVTQPRRIAAMSVARRVCQERNWALGTVVGFQVGMKRQVGDMTLLTYMTTGCLLEGLVARKSLESYTHIIMDEVHERDEDTDLLLMVVRKLMKDCPNRIKVILMSATADARKFSEYFPSYVEGKLRSAPIVEVPSGNPLTVNVYYLDDLKHYQHLTMFVPDLDPTEPKVEKQCYETAVRLIAAFDGRELRRWGENSDYKRLSNCRGAVLVFLPGIAEIDNMMKALMAYEDDAKPDEKNYWYILPLHSRITAEEQEKVFKPPPQNFTHYRKVILSTNIAESSITVPDIIYVVDFCLVKQLVADPVTNFCSLRTEWAPRSSCVQRQGRVGRVNDGNVYRMVPRHFYENHLPEDVSPEILRCPLDKAILRTKLLELGPPKALLGLLIDPPQMDSIVRTIAMLKEVGALFVTSDGVWSAEDGDLSFLGRVVAKLPVDVHLGKLIMLGYVFNMLEECIIMAAGMGSKNIFTSRFSEKLRAYQVKMHWAEGSFSDPITLLNAYQVWKEHERTEYFKRSGQSEREREKRWARENYIQLKALKDMDELVTELKRRLHSLGIESPAGPNMRPLTDCQKGFVLRVVLFGAFYPNYFSRDALSGRIEEREAVRSLCGADPYSTVQLKNFPMDHPPKAYVHQIKLHLKDIFEMLIVDTWNVKITFDSSRVFITFHQEGNPAQKKKVPGQICLPVYLAIKQKQLRLNYTIQLLRKDAAERYSRRVEEMARNILGACGSDTESVASGRSGRSEVPYMLQMPPPRMPKLSEEYLRVSVCHIEDPRHFWCHRLDLKSKMDYKQISDIIGPSASRLRPWVSGTLQPQPPAKGTLVMAPFASGNGPPEYYRAKVLSVFHGSNIPVRDRRVRVTFIDFGNVGEPFVRDLRIFPDALLSIPPLAFPCHLTGVKASLIDNLRGEWTETAKDWFKELALDKHLFAKVYSVVNGKTSMDLIPETEETKKIPMDSLNWEESLANQMLYHKYAVKAEEPYSSLADHTERQDALGKDSKSAAFNDRTKLQEMEQQRMLAAELMATEELSAEPHDFAERRVLHGPFSPLEMKMYGKVKSLVGATVKIEDDSVNSVILDDQPEDGHERILVAAQVGTQLHQNKVIARATTLLPNIPGLPAILTLMFAPRAEFRANAERKMLTGAICGLGYDKDRNNQSFYPEHDMEIVFDARIDLHDVLLVNKTRYWMTTVLGPKSYSDAQTGPSKERMREVSAKVLQLLFDLIKHRPDIEVVPTASYKWNLVHPEHVLAADAQDDQLLSLHNCIKLVP